MKSQTKSSDQLSIVILGASGDLAVKKVFPALFSLYCRNLLPERFFCYGFARTEMSDAGFHELLMHHLTCRYTPGSSECRKLMDEFLMRCQYISGYYDAPESFYSLKTAMEKKEEKNEFVTRLFYFSVPPFLFMPVAHSLSQAELTTDIHGKRACRVVIEKPFGRNRQSSDDLTSGLAQVLTEEQTYRIDHYLGKEVIQNLMVLRFANLIFEPLWNRVNIAHVQITWMEDIGVEGRAGYFDSYGIIRDVMQNHLLQIVALTAMEEPLSLNPEYIRDEKVKALRSIAPVKLDDIVVGQYTSSTYESILRKGYLEEEGIPSYSITPTYAAVALKIRNRRWDGIPFLIRAGKALNGRKTEIRVVFRDVPANIFASSQTPPEANELVIRVQPDAGISLSFMNKMLGLRMSLNKTHLNLSYADLYEQMPDAYESLLLDVIKGDKSLFIRADELAAAWDVFTPVLSDLESCTIQPQGYPFGSDGPQSAGALAALYGTTWR